MRGLGEQERRPHDDPDDHPAVTERQLVPAGRGAVVDPPGAVDPLAPTSIRGVIDREVQIGTVDDEVGQDQIEHGQVDQRAVEKNRCAR